MPYNTSSKIQGLLLNVGEGFGTSACVLLVLLTVKQFIILNVLVIRR